MLMMHHIQREFHSAEFAYIDYDVSECDLTILFDFIQMINLEFEIYLDIRSKLEKKKNVVFAR